MENDEVELAKLYKRLWLNEDTGSAYAIISATSEEHWKTKDGRSLYVDLELKDCSRQICLEFSASTDEEYKAKLRKIDTLVAALHEMKAFMLEHPVIEGKIKRNSKARVIDLDEE